MTVWREEVTENTRAKENEVEALMRKTNEGGTAMSRKRGFRRRSQF